MFFFHLIFSNRPTQTRDIPQTESGRSEKESELANPDQRVGIIPETEFPLGITTPCA